MKWAIRLGLLLLVMVLAGGLGGGVGALLYSEYFAPRPPPPNKSQGERLQGLKESFGKVRSPNPNPLIAALGRLEPRGGVINIAGGMMGAIAWRR